MKISSKIVSFAISVMAFVFCQQAKALPPYFHSARWAGGAEVDSSAIGNRIPLVLIHGLQEDSTVWTAFLTYWSNSPDLRSKFKPFEFGYYTDNSEITSTDPTSVYQLGQDLGGYLEQGSTYGLNGAPVAIVAHSMGGLVARSMMANYFFADHSKGDSKVSLLITLATPHHGTPAANIGYMFAVGYPVVGQVLHYFDNVNVGFLLNLAWDDYDGKEFWFPGPSMFLSNELF